MGIIIITLGINVTFTTVSHITSHISNVGQASTSQAERMKWRN